ncbi:hypothetical protein HRR83_005379 [Exophiala dermatitidis]|uniref:Uncharacterized protein n=1 Tax=Exophiala dermatitidis TaxID=5970 RepID=A0AAN6EU83_EXODE|nr:hypothetical protein HRR74_005232 [Exophiala dermatitidis]KAJ4518520.1 hypothetical protein HRR73_004101 [Exophiala dermatitidis]KAJ4534019.1 hypothetical protein HRR76_005966 [Exophiala dermatitidis]KAJ4550175.1 hypothetical protein HRR77_003652 [Exophiala dermatitidis]KAJ4571578.1 hypothetical protein HRR81_005609 [Exophiala dermatitidis]
MTMAMEDDTVVSKYLMVVRTGAASRFIASHHAACYRRCLWLLYRPLLALCVGSLTLPPPLSPSLAPLFSDPTTLFASFAIESWSPPVLSLVLLFRDHYSSRAFCPPVDVIIISSDRTSVAAGHLVLMAYRVTAIFIVFDVSMIL